ncbi:MAG: glucuronate isomerase [Ruminococcaceae bacterium]|nr:glucuronate isomerase [Oscillospiraceae bacterium]
MSATHVRSFMDENFLLTTETAQVLYHGTAAELPIIDYHCHVSPREIYEDVCFENITRLWLSGDHYKWRLMRWQGVPECYITGDASDYDKFIKFAECLPRAIGNPMYHWCHLELKRYFGYEGLLNAETAPAVWRLTQELLTDPAMSVRNLIQKSRVAFIGTTDDPVDSLIYHEKLAEDQDFPVIVAPTFRPDKAIHIHKAGWRDYIAKLAEVSGTDIQDMATLTEALGKRMTHFAEHGCRAADLGMDYMVCRPVSKDVADTAFAKAMSGRALSEEEAEGYMTYLLLYCGTEFARLGWVMQIHCNCLRNPNTKMLERLGPDSGFDCIGPDRGDDAMARFLDWLDSRDVLPKTILYSLREADNGYLAVLAGAYQGEGIPGKVQQGSAWWFNDHLPGMKKQLTDLACVGILGNFVGMLTDSRSFLSYTRHEYFRRALCDLIGQWVENGEYPQDAEMLRGLVTDICYHNALRYFDLEVRK